MENLKYLCTKLVCSNLYLYYLICSKKSWRIPEKLGNDLLNYITDNNCELDDNHLKIFSKDVISFSNICLSRKIATKPTFLSNIDADSLTEITIPCAEILQKDEFMNIIKNLLKKAKNLEKFTIISKSFISSLITGLRETANSLQYFYLSEKITTESPIKILKKCTKLKKIIINQGYMKIIKEFKISDAIYNSSNNLMHLELSRIYINEDNLMETLSICINLHTIKLNYIQNFNNKLSKFFSKYDNIYNSIEEIDLSNNRKLSLEINQDFYIFFTKFPNIQNISLNFNTTIDNTCVKEDKDLSTLVCSSLKRLSFRGCQFDKKSFQHLKNVLKCCTQLEIIDFSSVFHLEQDLSYLFHGLLQVKHTLRCLHFEKSCLNKYDFEQFGHYLLDCSNIQKLSIGGDRLTNDNLSVVIDNLSLSKNYLNEFSLNNCKLNTKDLKIIGEYLKKCSYLKYFSIDQSILNSDGLNGILHNLTNSINTIKEIHIRNQSSFQNIFRSFNQFFKKFKGIEKIIKNSEKLKHFCLIELINSKNGITRIFVYFNFFSTTNNFIEQLKLHLNHTGI